MLFICILNHVVHQNMLTFSTFYRKKSKWDNVGLLGGITISCVTPVTGAIPMDPLAASCPTIPQVYQVPLILQQTATVIQKLIQVSYMLGIGFSLFMALKDLFCLNCAAFS